MRRASCSPRGERADSSFKSSTQSADSSDMRLVATKRAADGSELGRDVLVGRADGAPLLRSGVRITSRYRDLLVSAGVGAIYVEDEAERRDRRRADRRRRDARTRDSSGSHRIQGRQGHVHDRETVLIRGGRHARGHRRADHGADRQCRRDRGGDRRPRDSRRVHLPALDRRDRRRPTDRKPLFPQARLGRLPRRAPVLHPDRQRLSSLGLGLLLHDIGKLAVPTRS